MRRVISLFLIALINFQASAKKDLEKVRYEDFATVVYTPIRTLSEDKLSIQFECHLKKKLFAMSVSLSGGGHGKSYAKFYNAKGERMLITFHSTYRDHKKYEAFSMGFTSEDLKFFQAGDIVRIELYDQVFDCNAESNEDLQKAIKRTNFYY